MAFKFVKSLSGDNFPLLHSVPTTENATIPSDAAITLTSGKAALASGTTKPRFISAGAVPAAASPASTPAQDVLPHFVWETTFSAAATSIHVGDKVTLHSDGLQVTATTASGVATVECMFGTAVGSTVWVRFE